MPFFLVCVFASSLLALLSPVSASLPRWNELDESYSFESFVNLFQKTYLEETEYESRRAIFEANLKEIVTHNRLKLTEKGGHVLNLNEFADLRPEEVPKGYSKALHRQILLTTPLSATSQLSVSLHSPVSTLPKAVDWRSKGVSTPVKSQGHCGSCWAFSSTSVLESHIALRTGTLFTLSVQEMVSCATNPLHCGGAGGCAGATAEIAFDYAKHHGIVEEWQFGYQDFDNDGPPIECTLQEHTNMTHQHLLRGSGSYSYLKDAVAAITGYVTLESNNYTTLMNAVAKLGPVAVSVAASPWHLYHGGVFYAPFVKAFPMTTDVNHLVALDGYGTDEETGEDYWLVKNSWGPRWGEAGYIRLKRVDPSTLDDPESDCAMDVTPADGDACTKDKDGNDISPVDEKVCGTSGVLSGSAVPLGGFLLDKSGVEQDTS